MTTMGQGSPPVPPVVWRVTGQAETTELGPTGQAVSGWRVSFQTGAGTVGSVFVPAASYTAANVRAAIAEVAANLADVEGLSSETPAG